MVWTLICSATAAALGLMYVAALLAGEATRREGMRLYKRLLVEQTFRDLLPTTRPAWEAAARYAEMLTAMDEAQAAEILRRAADASRRRADRMEAVRRVMAEAERPAAAARSTEAASRREA